MTSVTVIFPSLVFMFLFGIVWLYLMHHKLDPEVLRRLNRRATIALIPLICLILGLTYVSFTMKVPNPPPVNPPMVAPTVIVEPPGPVPMRPGQGI